MAPFSTSTTTRLENRAAARLPSVFAGPPDFAGAFQHVNGRTVGRKLNVDRLMKRPRKALVNSYCPSRLTQAADECG